MGLFFTTEAEADAAWAEDLYQKLGFSEPQPAQRRYARNQPIPLPQPAKKRSRVHLNDATIIPFRTRTREEEITDAFYVVHYKAMWGVAPKGV
jgi:hypothetical protein